MRLLVLFLVCSIGLTYAADSYAQKALISIDVRNQRVEDILKEIEEQSDFDFFFNNKHVDLNRRVSVSADKSNIFSVLKEIFSGTNVKYSVLDKKIILSIEAQSPEQEKKITVSGTISDAQGEPIIGASVLEKGVQGNGTITDIDGNFKISVSSSKAQLDISYIGYQSQTVAVQPGITAYSPLIPAIKAMCTSSYREEPVTPERISYYLIFILHLNHFVFSYSHCLLRRSDRRNAGKCQQHQNLFHIPNS